MHKEIPYRIIMVVDECGAKPDKRLPLQRLMIGLPAETGLANDGDIPFRDEYK